MAEDGNIFELSQTLGYQSPFGNWVKDDFKNLESYPIKIISMFISDDDPLVQLIKIRTREDSQYVYVPVVVHLSLTDFNAEVQISTNDGVNVKASHQLGSTLFKAVFEVAVPKKLAPIDTYNQKTVRISAEVKDLNLNSVSDTRIMNVVLDTATNIINVSDFKSKSPCGCICTKSQFDATDVKCIVSELRKKQIIHKNYFTVKDDTGKVIGYEDHTLYNDTKAGGSKVGDSLFYLNRSEQLQESERNYNDLSIHLNKVFNKYQINTCLRKIHFLAQIYQETMQFRATYEATINTSYDGGDFYQGRGMLHLTHKYNYKAYYTAVFNKEPSSVELEKFVPLVASRLEYAMDSAGWFWNKNNINYYADIDSIEKVSAAINYPELLKDTNFDPYRLNGFENRKKFYQFLKEVFDYENCK